MVAVDEFEPIKLPPVRATEIQGTEELWQQTQFKKANYARQKRERGGAVLTIHRSCKRDRVKTINTDT